ncbi:MAG TPA: DUF1552 domain-containing protein [Polyangia bacterium]|jgi:hypothetical protein|nr:DUF1552 domain-containing protein [Polyangia bacterium]
MKTRSKTPPPSSGSSSGSSWVFSRRAALRGAFGASIGLPWLASLGARRAHAAGTPAFPTRFVVMFSPNGTLPGAWNPMGTETSFTLSPILQPLAEHQGDLVVVRGVDQQGGGGDGHQNGMGGMLTGQPLNAGPFAGAGSAPAGWPNGPSVDQRVAEVLGTGTKLRSLELGVQVGAADNWGRMVYRAANQPLPPEDDPARVYADVFADLHADPAVLAALRARRRSILDTVAAQYARLSARLGGDDRARIDRHLTAVREIELRLTTPFAGATAACQDPAPAPAPATSRNDDFPAIGALQIDLLVMALACDVARVASLQWSRSVSQTRFTWLTPAIPEVHHDLSHRPDNDGVAADKLVRINRWYATQLATLMSKLKAIPEGDGTLLDHTLILWCNELAVGNVHSRVDAPYVLGGRAGGRLATGRYLTYAGDVPHNNLMVSILNAMGIPDQTFGKPDWCTGPLAGLV